MSFGGIMSKNSFTVAVLAGDGIGPEVMTAARLTLDALAERFSLTLRYVEALIGGAAYEEYGVHFPDETATVCDAADAILFGSVGGPIDAMHEAKWKGCEVNSILALRKRYSFYGNIRPARIYPGLQSCSPLRLDATESIDLVVVRELIGDCYFGTHTQDVRDGERYGTDEMQYRESQITAIAHLGFQTAMARGKRLVSVDKANVLASSKVWREVVSEIAEEYPEVDTQHMLVDNCAMQLIKNPGQFDVMLTPNLFGDILSDAAAVLPGSLGLMPSASINDSSFGLYEPSGGSAQDIAGKDCANPVGQILSAAMMLRYSFDLEDEARALEVAVEKTLGEGVRTADLQVEGSVSTSAFAEAVVQNIQLA